MVIDLGRVDRITVDAVGPPGSRVFYIQARRGDRLLTLLVEKQQVQLLAASVVEILSRLGKDIGEGPPEESMSLEEPLLPEWRAGRLSIGYDEEDDLLVLEVDEAAETEEEEEEGEEDEGDEEAEDGITDDEADLADALADVLAADVAADTGDDDDEPQRVRLSATREQMLAFARHGAAVCAAGRPRCQLCGNPIDPEGHNCPALNGHRPPGAS